MQPSNPRLFGRRKGRPLRVRKSRLMQELLPELLITLDKDKPFRPSTFFKRAAPLWLEIGFGGGEHLVGQAKLNPDIHFIGCEPFMNGVASLLDHVEKEQVNNVRIFNNDARLLLAALKDSAIEKCFVLFPDPWPKTRHAARRFINGESVKELVRVLKKGGTLRVASDHPTLIKWMRAHLDKEAAFASVYGSSEPPQGWLQTRYQEKAMKAKRSAFFMDYIKK